MRITALTRRGIRRTLEPEEKMRLDANLVRNRAIINVTDETFGVTFTHWTRKRRSWSLRWKDVTAIEVMLVESVCFTLTFYFQVAEERWAALSDDMENWNALEEAVRKRFPDFSWNNVETAKRFENKNKRFPCWKQENAAQSK